MCHRKSDGISCGIKKTGPHKKSRFVQPYRMSAEAASASYSESEKLSQSKSGDPCLQIFF